MDHDMTCRYSFMKSIAFSVTFFVLLTGCIEGSSSRSIPNPDNDSDDIPTDPIPDDPKEVPAFLSYCKAGANPPDVQHTVDKLVELVTYETGEDLSCDIAFRRLKSDSDEVNLSNMGIKSLLPFGGLDGINVLTLSGNEITNIAGLDKIKSLSYLDLSGNKITDISGIVKNKSLVSLDVSKNPITEIGELSKLEELRMLVLNETLIADASTLGKSHIQRLDMQDMPNLKDYSFVGEMENIKGLWIAGAGLTSLDFLTKKNSELVFVNFSRNEISDASPLLKFKNLIIVSLGFNKIHSIDGFFDLADLEYLNVSDNEINAVNPDAIEGKSILESLNIGQNENLQDLSFIAKLAQLRELDFSRSGVQHIPNLANHVYLTSIEAQANQLTKESVLNILRAKKALSINLKENKITGINLPEDHPELALLKLDVSENPDLISLDFLKKAPALTSLIAYRSSIPSFPDDVGLELTKLDLGVENNPSVIDRIFKLPKLEELNLVVHGSDPARIDLRKTNETVSKLNLSGPSLEGSSFLKFLPNLSELSITGMALPELVWAVDQPLKKLNLSANCITTVEALVQAPKIWDTLEELNLEDNQITDLDLLPADKLEKLKVFEAENNGKKKDGCPDNAD